MCSGFDEAGVDSLGVAVAEVQHEPPVLPLCPWRPGALGEGLEQCGRKKMDVDVHHGACSHGVHLSCDSAISSSQNR